MPQLVQIDFGQGLDEKTDPRHVAPGKLLDASNVRFTKNGALEKRHGSTYLAAAGIRPVAHGAEVLTVSSTGALSSYSPASTAMTSRGQIAEAVVTREGLYADSLSPSNADIAYGNGVIVSVWMGGEDVTAGADIYCSVIDATNGATIVPAYNVSGAGALAVYPRVVYLSASETFIILYAEATGNDIFVATVSAAYAISAANGLVVDNTAGSDFGVSALSDRYVIAYQGTGGTDAKVLAWSAASVLLAGSTIVDADVAAKFGFGVQCVAGECIWISYCSTRTFPLSNYVMLSRKNTSTLAELASFPAEITTQGYDYKASCPTRISATQVVVAISGQNTASDDDFISATVWTTSGVVAGVATQYNRMTSRCSFASAIFMASNGRAYAYVYTQGIVFTSLTPPSFPSWSCVLVDLGVTDTATTTVVARPVAVTMPRIAIADNQLVFGATYRAIPSVIQPETDKFQFVGRILKSNAGREGLVRVTADFTHAHLYGPAELGGTTSMVPGTTYDGVRAHELGFIQCLPESVIGTPIGGTLPAGDYAIVCVPEYVDANGNLHQGIPTMPRVVTAALNDQISITVPSVTLTNRQETEGQSVSWAVYMTAGTAGTVAGPFYRTTAVSRNILKSFPATGVTVAAITAPDTALASRPLLYTSGGVLENVCPPSFSAICAHRGRLWGIGDDQKTVWFSKVFVDGSGVAWSDDFTLPFDEKLTAIASMESAIVFFSEKSVYVLNGANGPNDQGNGSDIDTPIRLPGEVGCINQWSIVLTPQGLMFQSLTGLYLLTRGGELVYIGQPVEGLLTTYPTVRSAVAHPTDPYVEFACSNGSNSVRLVYDYRVGQWAADTIGTLGAGTKLGGECVADGVLYTVSMAGALVSESSGYLDEYVDGTSTWITMRVEVANIKLGGLQGFQRARHAHVLAERYTSHGLLIEIANDYASTYHQTFTWPWQDLDAMPREQMRSHLSVQKAQAVRVRITDSTPTGVGAVVGTGRGTSLKGLAFEVQQKPGPVRLSAQAKA